MLDFDALEADLRDQLAAIKDPRPAFDNCGLWKPAYLANKKKRAAIHRALHRLAISRHQSGGGPLPDGCSDEDCGFCRERGIYVNPFAAIDRLRKA